MILKGLSKEKVNISSISQINNKKIGVLSTDEKIITKYLSSISNTIINPYETSTTLFQALEANTEIEFALIPLEENLTSILTSNYYIDYHISDLNKYLVFDNVKFDEITLKNNDSGYGIKLSFNDFKTVGIWTPNHVNANFVCLEPWIGCADSPKSNGNFVDKKDVITLNPKDTFSTTYKITILK